MVASIRTCLLLAAFAAVWAWPSGAHAYEPRVPPGWFGISAPSLAEAARDGDPALGVHTDGIAAAGLDFVRSVVDWREVEPLLPVGEVHAYRWGATDRLVAALARRELEFVPNLVGTPDWARLLGTAPCGSLQAIDGLHAAAFGDFAEAVVRRYGPGGPFWAQSPEVPYRPISRIEIWNEPNWTGSWCPAPDPVAFSRVAVEAASGIRAADPGVEIVLGGVVVTREDQFFTDGGMRGMETGRFLRALTAAQPELASLIDHVGAHLYDPDPDFNLSQVGWLRGQLESAGLGAAGILVNEFGWHTSGGNTALSEPARAEAYTALLDQLPRTDCNVTGAAAHTWVTPEIDPADPEHWFGIADPATGALKPAGTAFRDAVALFEGAGPEPPPRETIHVCGAPPPDGDGDGTPDESDDYPLDPTRQEGSGEVPPEPDPVEQPLRPPHVPESFHSVATTYMPARPEERRLHFDSMAALGVRSVRETLEWDIVEPVDARGAPGRFAWGDPDRRIVSYAKRGIQPSVAPVHAPAWVPADPPAADARLAEFLAAVARRYGSDGSLWAENGHLDRTLAPRDYEVWTDASSDRSAWDGSASPAEYAATYATVRSALLAADPRARAIASLADAGDGSGAARFLEAMVRADPALAGRIDGVFLHASGARDAPAVEAAVARMREALDATGNGAARLEVGFGAPVAGPGSITEEARAAFVSQVAARLPRIDCDVDEAVLMSWTSAQSDPANPWDWYGVSAIADGTPGPTAQAFAQAARAASGYGTQEPPKDALHPCVRQPLDRDADGTPDPADPAPLDPSRSSPTAAPPPAPRFDAAPAAFSNVTEPRFAYSAVGATSFQCRLDQGRWFACGGEHRPAALTDGRHVFEARAVDSLGLVGPASRHEWTVDTRRPQTTIIAGPSGLTRTDSVVFELGSDEPESRFLCRLDGRPWEWCSARTAFTGLAEGGHAFEAAAVDRAGNGDASLEYRWFEVRTVPGTPSVSASGLETQRPTFRFDAAHASAFECRFDDAAFGPCSGAREHTPSRPLVRGPHRFEVRGVGPTGKRGPVAGWSFTTSDTDPPDTYIESGPDPLTASRDALVRLASDEDRVSYRCRIDGAAWAPCEASLSLSGLSEGPHVLEAVATDTAGLTDPTPARHEWTIAIDEEPPALKLGSAAVLRSGRVRLSYSARDAGGAVREVCRVDGKPWRSCDSPWLTGPLSRGRHRLAVRATDAAGNRVERSLSVRIRR